MAMTIKAILLEKNERLGTGLTALKTKEAEAIDITEFETALSDKTSTSALSAYIIKNNKAYTILRNYLDVDNNCRYVIAKCEENGFDRWPVI